MILEGTHAGINWRAFTVFMCLLFDTLSAYKMFLLNPK